MQTEASVRPSLDGTLVRLTPEVIDFKVGLFTSRSRLGRAVQSVGSYYLPGDTTSIRNPVRSAIYQGLTPGGSNSRLGRRIGGDRQFVRCPSGFEFGGRFAGRNFGNCGRRVFEALNADVSGISEATVRSIRRTDLPNAPQGNVREIVSNLSPARAVQIMRNAEIAPIQERNQSKLTAAVAAATNVVTTDKNKKTLLVRRDGTTLVPTLSIEELGNLRNNPDMENAVLVTRLDDPASMGEKEIPTLLKSNIDGVVFAFPGGARLDITKKRPLTPADSRRLTGAYRRAQGAQTSFNYDAGIVAAVDASGGALTYSGRFPGVKRPYERMTVENAEGQRRSVPRWVFEIFLSVSAPQRGKRASWTIVESFVEQAKTKSAQTNSVSFAESKQNLIEFKTATFLAENDFATYVFQVKRVAAVWDADLPPEGGYRCPPGTRYGGRITDRFGRNCGWNVGRRLANRLEDLGRAAGRIGERLDDRRDRNVRERIARKPELNAPNVPSADMTPVEGRRGRAMRQRQGRAADRLDRFADRIDGGWGRERAEARRRRRDERAEARRQRRGDRADRLDRFADRMDEGLGRGRAEARRQRADARRERKLRRDQRKLTDEERANLVEMVDMLEDADPRRDRAIERLRADGFEPAQSRLDRDVSPWDKNESTARLKEMVDELDATNPRRASVIAELRERGEDPIPNWKPRGENLLDDVTPDRAERRRQRRGDRADRLDRFADRMDQGLGRERAEARRRRRDQRAEARRQRRGERADRLDRFADRMDGGLGRARAEDRRRRRDERRRARRERAQNRADRLDRFADRMDEGLGRSRAERRRRRRDGRDQARVDSTQGRVQPPRDREQQRRRNVPLRDMTDEELDAEINDRADRLYSYEENTNASQREIDRLYNALEEATNERLRRQEAREQQRSPRREIDKMDVTDLTDDEIEAEINRLRPIVNDLNPDNPRGTRAERERYADLNGEYNRRQDQRPNQRPQNRDVKPLPPVGRPVNELTDAELDKEIARLEARVEFAENNNLGERERRAAARDRIRLDAARQEEDLRTRQAEEDRRNGEQRDVKPLPPVGRPVNELDDAELDDEIARLEARVDFAENNNLGERERRAAARDRIRLDAAREEKARRNQQARIVPSLVNTEDARPLPQRPPRRPRGEGRGRGRPQRDSVNNVIRDEFGWDAGNENLNDLDDNELQSRINTILDANRRDPKNSRRRRTYLERLRREKRRRDNDRRNGQGVQPQQDQASVQSNVIALNDVELNVLREKRDAVREEIEALKEALNMREEALDEIVNASVEENIEDARYWYADRVGINPNAVDVEDLDQLDRIIAEMRDENEIMEREFNRPDHYTEENKFWEGLNYLRGLNRITDLLEKRDRLAVLRNRERDQNRREIGAMSDSELGQELDALNREIEVDGVDPLRRPAAERQADRRRRIEIQEEMNRRVNKGDPAGVGQKPEDTLSTRDALRNRRDEMREMVRGLIRDGKVSNIANAADSLDDILDRGYERDLEEAVNFHEMMTGVRAGNVENLDYLNQVAETLREQLDLLYATADLNRENDTAKYYIGLHVIDLNKRLDALLRKRDIVQARRKAELKKVREREEAAQGIADPFKGDPAKLIADRIKAKIDGRKKILADYWAKRYGQNRPWADPQVNLPIDEIQRLATKAQSGTAEERRAATARLMDLVKNWYQHDEIVGAQGVRFRTRVVSMTADSFSVGLSVNVEAFDERLGEWVFVGRSSRSLMFDSKTVYSGSLFLGIDGGGPESIVVNGKRVKVKNAGFATIYNQHAWTWAKNAGFEKAEVSAVTDGPYVWGKVGYRDKYYTSYSRMAENFERELELYRAGRPSIIKNDEDAAIIAHLVDRSRHVNHDPERAPSHLEYIMALSDDGTDGRQQEIKSWFHDNAPFSTGQIDLTTDDLVIADPIQKPALPDKRLAALQKATPRAVVAARGLPFEPDANGRMQAIAITNPNITTKQQAIDHIRNGGSFSELPNEFWRDAAIANSSSDADDPNTVLRRIEPNGGAIGVTEIFIFRNPDGSTGGQGFVLKHLKTAYRNQQYLDSAGEIMGYILAADHGLITEGAGWDGRGDNGVQVAIIPHAFNHIPDGPVKVAEEFDPYYRDTVNYSVQELETQNEQGLPARVAHFIHNFALGIGDRHSQNGMSMLGPDGEAFIMPIDQAWAAESPTGVWSFESYLGVFAMDSDLKQKLRSYVRSLRGEEKEEFKKKMIAMYDELADRMQGVANEGEDALIQRIMKNSPFRRGTSEYNEAVLRIRDAYHNYALVAGRMSTTLRDEFVNEWLNGNSPPPRRRR